MGNSQAGAFRSQFESVDLREATKNNLWQHYRCVKNVSMSTLSTSAATTAQQEDRFPLSPRGGAAETTTAVLGPPSPSPTTTATSSSSSSQSGGTVAVSTVKTSLTMLQLNVQHNSFKASLSAPRSPNPDAALPSQYKLQYRMLDTCYHAAQWCQRHPHPSLLRVEDICFSPEDKTLCVVLPYASLDPVAPRLPSLTAMEILYGLTKVAEGLAHLHSNGVAHRALSWNAVYVSTVHPVKGAPPTVFSALPESGQWVLSNIQFMGGGVTSSDEVSALKNFLLEVRGLRESSAVPSNCVAPEWNNPMGATVSWTSVPCGAGDVYSFGAMILSLLPEGATQRQSAASLSTIFSSSVASSLMPEDLNVNDVTSQRVTMELRKFAERCMSEDPMKRPHVEEFFELRCCRHSVFVQTMQSLDHLRSTPNLRDRLRLFYLLHVELLKIPYEALVQKVLPRLLQLRVWRDPAAEYFLRHLLTPLGSSTYTDLGDHPAVIGAPLDPAHLVELVRLHGDLSKQSHKRAPWLGVLLNGESLSSSHHHSSKADIAFRIAVRRCADWYGPSSTTSASVVSTEQQVVKKALREYQLFDLDSALEIALFDGRSGARTEMAPSPNPKDPQSRHSITDPTNHADAEAAAAETQDDEEDADELKRSGGGGSSGATEAGREYDIPLLPVVGLVLNSDFRALVVPFLVKLFNVVVACGAQPEVLLRTGIHARVLVALLRNMDAYLNGVSVSQVVVPCLIPFLRVCLTHPEADIVLSALMALKHLAQRIEGAIAKQPPPNSAAASSAQQQEQDDEEGKAGTTEEGEAGRASETVEGSDSSSSPKPKSDPSPRDSGATSLLETLLAAARALCAIFNKEVLSIACSDAVPSLRLAALILLVKTILRPASHAALDSSQKDGASNRTQAASSSSASPSIGAGRTEAIAALCHCFWIGLNGNVKMPPTAVQSVETGMRRVAYRAAIFALKNTGMFLPAELSDDIIPAALNAYYQWVSGASSTASNNSSNTTRKSSNTNSTASIDGGCPLETTLLQLVHAATEYLSKDGLLHDDGDSKDPTSKKQQHRSSCWTTREGKSTAAFRCGAIAAVQGSVQPRQGGADGGKGGPLLLPGRYTPLRLTRSEFDQLPYVSFQDFDQEWNARGGIFLPAVAVSSGSSAATHTFTCSTKAHPLAILLPSRSETLLCPPAAAASSVKGKTSSSIFGSASEDGMNSLPRRGGKQQSTSGVPINAPSQSQEQQVTPHPSDPAEKDARSLPAVQPNHSSSSSYSSSSSKPPSRKRIHVDLEQFESTSAVLASTTDHHEPGWSASDEAPPAAQLSSSLQKEESSGADVVVPSQTTAAAARDVLTPLQAVETDELSSSLGSTARSDAAAPVATAANPIGRATSSSSKTSAAPRRKKPSFTGGRPGGSAGGADQRVIGEDDL